MRTVSRAIFKTNLISTKDNGPSCSLGVASSLSPSVFYINLNSWVSHNAEDLPSKNNDYQSTGVHKISNHEVRHAVSLVCGLTGYWNLSSLFQTVRTPHFLWAIERYSKRGAYSWYGDTGSLPSDRAVRGFQKQN